MKDEPTAFAAVLLHVVLVSGAVIISALNWKDHYIGGELVEESDRNDEKLLVLQFAVKIHELMMMIPLSACVFIVIRRQLMMSDGILFGAISTGL